VARHRKSENLQNLESTHVGLIILSAS